MSSPTTTSQDPLPVGPPILRPLPLGPAILRRTSTYVDVSITGSLELSERQVRSIELEPHHAFTPGTSVIVKIPRRSPWENHTGPSGIILTVQTDGLVRLPVYNWSETPVTIPSWATSSLQVAEVRPAADSDKRSLFARPHAKSPKEPEPSFLWLWRYRHPVETTSLSTAEIQQQEFFEGHLQFEKSPSLHSCPSLQNQLLRLCKEYASCIPQAPETTLAVRRYAPPSPDVVQLPWICVSGGHTPKWCLDARTWEEHTQYSKGRLHLDPPDVHQMCHSHIFSRLAVQPVPGKDVSTEGIIRHLNSRYVIAEGSFLFIHSTNEEDHLMALHHTLEAIRIQERTIDIKTSTLFRSQTDTRYYSIDGNGYSVPQQFRLQLQHQGYIEDASQLQEFMDSLIPYKPFCKGIENLLSRLRESMPSPTQNALRRPIDRDAMRLLKIRFAESHPLGLHDGSGSLEDLLLRVHFSASGTVQSTLRQGSRGAVQILGHYDTKLLSTGLPGLNHEDKKIVALVNCMEHFPVLRKRSFRVQTDDHLLYRLFEDLKNHASKYLPVKLRFPHLAQKSQPLLQAMDSLRHYEFGRFRSAQAHNPSSWLSSLMSLLLSAQRRDGLISSWKSLKDGSDREAFLRQSHLHNRTYATYWKERQDQLIVETRTPRERIVLPACPALKKLVIKTAHLFLDHCGVAATLKFCREHTDHPYFPIEKEDVQNVILQCQECELGAPSPVTMLRCLKSCDFVMPVRRNVPCMGRSVINRPSYNKSQRQSTDEDEDAHRQHRTKSRRRAALEDRENRPPSPGYVDWRSSTPNDSIAKGITTINAPLPPTHPYETPRSWMNESQDTHIYSEPILDTPSREDVDQDDDVKMNGGNVTKGTIV